MSECAMQFLKPGQYVRILSAKGELRGVRRLVSGENGRLVLETPAPTGTQAGDQIVPCEPDFIGLDRRC